VEAQASHVRVDEFENALGEEDHAYGQADEEGSCWPRRAHERA